MQVLQLMLYVYENVIEEAFIFYECNVRSILTNTTLKTAIFAPKWSHFDISSSTF